MKKITSIMTALLCCALFTTSCHTDDEIGQTDNYPRDTSLAGSVSFSPSQSIIVAEGIYGETILKDLVSNQSRLDTDKVSDTKIGLDCHIIWGATEFNISIPKIPLSGVAYDATFDYTSDAASVTYNDNQYHAVKTTIKGWIKEVPLDVNKSLSKSVSHDIAPIFYECEITITCTIDEKPLNIKITEVSPY